MTREDLYYLPPDSADEPRCVYEADGDQCGAPTGDGPLCEAHPAETPEEYDAYARLAA